MTQCSFCHEDEAEAMMLIVCGDVCICSMCVELGKEVIGANGPKRQSWLAGRAGDSNVIELEFLKDGTSNGQ